MVLDPASYKGTVVSDNAAVYGKFSNAQKCWAQLLRNAIKLTLLDPKNKEFIDFADGAFQILYGGRSLQKNQSISEEDREAEIVKPEDRVLALCSVREIETQKLEDATADSFRLLRGELLGLSLREKLFTFVSNPAVAPTNNEAERTLRDPVLEAEQELESFSAKWDAKYPTISEAIEVAAHRNDLRASYADPKSDLHDERDRVRQ